VDVPGVDPLKYQQPANLSASAGSDEAMTVKLRYKEPDGATSSLLSVVVGNHPSTSPALGFAAAVAEFGMVLRDSEFKGASSYAGAEALAVRFKGDDAPGHRAEFIRLISAADSVSRLRSSRGSNADPPASTRAARGQQPRAAAVNGNHSCGTCAQSWCFTRIGIRPGVSMWRVK
jgi:hypothetical protein